MVIAHFDVSRDLERNPDEAFVGDLEAYATPDNSGMAVVVPAQRIANLLMNEEFERAREEMRTKMDASLPVASPGIRAEGY